MNRTLATAGKVILVALIVPVALVVTAVTALLGIKAKRTPAEVASVLRDFADGKANGMAWDDFTSVPIADPRLEDIRNRALAIELPATDDGMKALRLLQAEVERLSS
jgi:hypothetical protein